MTDALKVDYLNAKYSTSRKSASLRELQVNSSSQLGEIPQHSFCFASLSPSWKANAWEKIMSKLVELGALEDNWDGYGADAPNKRALLKAGLGLAYSDGLGLPLARITPSAEGGVALCYFASFGYAIIEFYNDGEVAAMTKKGQDESYWDVDTNEIKEALDKVRGFLNGRA